MGSFADFVTNYGVIDKTARDETALQNQRDYEAQARALGIQRDQAENELIPEKQAAARAKMGLSTAQDTASTGLVAPKAKLEGTQLTGQQAVAENTNAQMPTFLGMNNSILRTQANAAKVAAGESGVQLEHLPQHLAALKQANRIDDQKQSMLNLGGLAYAMSSGDHQQAIDYANEALKQYPVPGKEGAVVSHIIPEAVGADGKTPVVRMVDAQGNTIMDIPHASIQAGFNMLTPPILKELGANQKLVRVNPITGSAKDVISNHVDRFDIKDGIYFDRDGAQTPQRVGGTHDRLLINDGVQQLVQDFGAKMDPLSKMIDASTIKDPAGFAAARAELAARVQQGEEPMAVAKDLSDRYRKKQAVRESTGKDSNSGYTGPTPWKR